MKLKDTIKFFMKYISKEKKLFIGASVLLFLSALSNIFYGMMVGEATQYAIEGMYKTGVIMLLIYFTLAVIDVLILSRIGNIKVSHLTNNLMEKMSFDVFRKVSKLPAKAFEEKTSGELINRINSDSANISDTMGQIINIALQLFSSSMVFIYILFNSRIIALEIIIYMVIVYFVSKKYLPLIREEQEKITTDNDQVVAEVSETIKGIREVKALGITNKITERIKNILELRYSRSKKQVTIESKYNAIVYTLSTALETGVFITCLLLVFFEQSTFGFFVSMTYYIYRFTFTVQSVMNITKSYQKMNVSIKRINEITSNKLYEDQEYGNIDKTDINGKVEYKNVSFKYEDQEKNIFNNLNLEINPNKITAIVGKSGQGKTSLFNLLLRYFDVNSGELLIDGINIKDFTEESLRQNVSIIRQDPFVFNKTILENFKIIDEEFSLEEIRKSCSKAEIDEYIMSLPNGYDTLIGEGGVNLSGGQKQRLAIARALLRKSKIILFDEATSALDNQNQEKIKTAITNLSKNHTIIIVAHRLTTIENADVIHVVDNGNIVSSGIHDELLQNSEIYSNLYAKEEKQFV